MIIGGGRYGRSMGCGKIAEKRQQGVFELIWGHVCFTGEKVVSYWNLLAQTRHLQIAVMKSFILNIIVALVQAILQKLTNGVA